MKISSLSLLTILGLTLSCATMNKINKKHDSTISIGWLGGFAGSYQECKLSEKGELYKKSKFKQEFAKIREINTQNTSQIFALIENFEKLGITLNDPGNLTYFIRWSDKNKVRMELIWGGNQIEVNQQVQIFFNNLSKQCKDNHPIR